MAGGGNQGIVQRRSFLELELFCPKAGDGQSGLSALHPAVNRRSNSGNFQIVRPGCVRFSRTRACRARRGRWVARRGRRAWEARARGRAELTRPGSGGGGAGVRSGCASRTFRGVLVGLPGGWRSVPGGKPPREVRAEPGPGRRGRRGQGLQAVPESPGAGVGPWGRCPESAALWSSPTPAAARPPGAVAFAAWVGADRSPEQLRAVPELRGRGQLGREGGGGSPLGPGPEPLHTPHLAFLRSAVGVVPLCCRGAPGVEEGWGGERRDRWLRGRGMVREGWLY